MKLNCLILVLLFPVYCTAQIDRSYKNCRTNECKTVTSYSIAKAYLETDQLDLAQKWLNITIGHHPPLQPDTITCHIHSLQSELFYYMGLFQFGTHEAKKGIQKSKQLNDSLLIADAYFFLGINRFELKRMEQAQESLLNARKWFPKINRKRMAYTVEEEHIDNNIAQLKLKINEPDSAIRYNEQAYKSAKRKNSKRGVPNVEQTFGEIYLYKNLTDSAAYYFEKSTESALKNEYYDIALINYGLLINTFSDKPQKVLQYFGKGESLMQEKTINAFFRHYFYELALKTFKRSGSVEKVAEIQDKIIKMDEESRIMGNNYLQEITEQYIKTENQVLVFKAEKFRKQRNFTILLVVSALLCILVMTLAIRALKNRNKLQKTLLIQKNEISKDLHDDVGSGLSSILIYADMLTKNKDTNETQNILASKIIVTGTDISQKLNTFIWSLNNSNNTLRHFCEYVKVYGTNLFEGTDVKFNFSSPAEENEAKVLNGHFRKNLFLCVKELLNNSLKHSKATEVKISINTAESNFLQITIYDNGTGIQKENVFGNGILNIDKRVRDLDGTIEYQNISGFSAKMSVPF